MTTKNAIKLLPLDNTLKMQLLSMYDFMEPDQKRTIERIAWNTYFYLYNQKTQYTMAVHFRDVEEGKAEFGNNFYPEVAKLTEDEMTKKIAESEGAADLALARRAMEQIINEIKDSNKLHKTNPRNN